jgi:signal transduction histidine kinase/CheY-like chemotaxis protein
MALVLLATLLPALLVGWRFFRECEAEVAAATQSLSRAADRLADEMDQRVQGTAQLLFGLAHSRDLESGDRAKCSAFLSQVREAYPQYTGIISVLPDGSLFCDSLRSDRKLNLTDRAYFKRALAGRDELVLEPVFGRLTGIPVLQIVSPVRDDAGALQYMLVASLNLQKFAQGSWPQELGGAAALLVMDHQGTVLVWSGTDPARQAPGSSIKGSELLRLAETEGSGSGARGGIGEIGAGTDRAQVWAVAAASKTRNVGLHVMLGQPRQQLVADSRNRLRQDLVVLAVLALLLFVGVWLLAEWSIRRQVSRITAMVRSLGEGDLAARVPLPYPRGELGGLMAALNSTADSLQRQRAAIDELGLKLRRAQRLEAIGTLAGGIAHDFNNIVGAILGNLSLAQEEAQTGQPARESLGQIRRAALRARDLVERIQAFARQEKPSLSDELLRPIVQEVVALIQVALPPGAELRTELDDEAMPVRADLTQLHQVLMNLCTNAIQALQGEPGTVTVSLRAVTFGTGGAAPPAGLDAGRHAHLCVSDTGKGIAAEHLERIFEPYFTTKGAKGGTGLGLSVVHGIVAAHRGSMVVESTPGQGSRFHVYLPLIDGQVQPAEPAAQAAAPAGRGQQVLYLDDDEVMGLMVERLLGRAGYRVRCFLSAAQALAALRSEPSAYDLVLTDFNMPECSGIEVSRSVAELRPGLPVILISGHVFDTLVAQARRAGVLEVVRKQHLLEELVPAIARALGGSPAGDQRAG